MRAILGSIALLAASSGPWANELWPDALESRIQVAQLAQTDAQATALPSAAQDKRITAAIAREATGEPLTKVPANTPRLYLRWQGEALSAGDKVRCVWIAEDVGDAAPANYHVDEAVTTAADARPFGIFILSRPTKGWPIGRYRAEIYVSDTLAETLRFTIEQTEP